METEHLGLYREPELYDRLFGPYGESGPQVDFYRRQIARIGEPTLELACGSGRLLIPFAEAGVDIAGIDLSEPMLALAREKAVQRGVEIDVAHADVRDFHLGRTFRCIFIPANAMHHLLTRQDVERCLACVRRHLTSDGRFIIGILNPSLAILSRDPDGHYPVGEYDGPDGAGKVIVTEQNRYDSVTQINRVCFTHRWEDSGDTLELRFAMRMFFPQEIEALLVYNSFVVEAVYGDYGEEPLAPESPKQLLVCKVRCT
jgi:SAM-dependent methyltransferase